MPGSRESTGTCEGQTVTGRLETTPILDSSGNPTGDYRSNPSGLGERTIQVTRTVTGAEGTFALGVSGGMTTDSNGIVGGVWMVKR